MTTIQSPSRRLVNLASAGQYADVHPRTLRRWIASGLLTGYRVGPRLLKVDLNELDAMMTPIPTAASTGGDPQPPNAERRPSEEEAAPKSTAKSDSHSLQLAAEIPPVIRQHFTEGQRAAVAVELEREWST